MNKGPRRDMEVVEPVSAQVSRKRKAKSTTAGITYTPHGPLPVCSQACALWISEANTYYSQSRLFNDDAERLELRSDERAWLQRRPALTMEDEGRHKQLADLRPSILDHMGSQPCRLA